MDAKALTVLENTDYVENLKNAPAPHPAVGVRIRQKLETRQKLEEQAPQKRARLGFAGALIFGFFMALMMPLRKPTLPPSGATQAIHPEHGVMQDAGAAYAPRGLDGGLLAEAGFERYAPSGR